MHTTPGFKRIDEDALPNDLYAAYVRSGMPMTERHERRNQESRLVLGDPDNESYLTKSDADPMSQQTDVRLPGRKPNLRRLRSDPQLLQDWRHTSDSVPPFYDLNRSA